MQREKPPKRNLGMSDFFSTASRNLRIGSPLISSKASALGHLEAPADRRLVAHGPLPAMLLHPCVDQLDQGVLVVLEDVVDRLLVGQVRPEPCSTTWADSL